MVHTDVSTSVQGVHVPTVCLCGDMCPLWPLTPKGNYYFLEGALDALLCGNSSDAG